MDNVTLDRIAEMICGNGDHYPIYRSSSALTSFFENAGLSKFVHDGSTRQRWVLDCLKACEREELAQVLKRLASPQEYYGDRGVVQDALARLNDAVYLEGFAVRLNGIEPYFEKIDINFETDAQISELQPLPAPDFSSLNLDTALAKLLAERWNEAQRCVDAQSYLAATIMMGGLLEGLLIGSLQNFPKQANQSSASPKRDGKVKRLAEWSLSQMIDVAHEQGWIDLDIKKFSHALRDFRNLVHPNEQLSTGANPDKDTCNISWLVVQAAVNDLARVLKSSSK